MFGKIQNGKYHFKHKEFDDCSDEVKDLINRMLTVDPKKRISAKGALEHPWFERLGRSKSLVEISTRKATGEVLSRL